MANSSLTWVRQSKRGIIVSLNIHVLENNYLSLDRIGCWICNDLTLLSVLTTLLKLSVFFTSEGGVHPGQATEPSKPILKTTLSRLQMHSVDLIPVFVWLFLLCRQLHSPRYPACALDFMSNYELNVLRLSDCQQVESDLWRHSIKLAGWLTSPTVPSITIKL